MADVTKIILGIIVVISTILNLGTCYLLVTKKRKNQYIILCIYIAVSDLIQTLLGYVPEIMFDMKESDILCKGTAFCVAFSAFASISLLTLVSVLKVVGIKKPFKNDILIQKKYSVHILAAIGWIYAFLWAVPPLIGWSKFTLEATQKRCSIDWAPKTIAGRCYLWMLIAFAFVIPVSINFISFRLSGSVIKQFTKRCKSTYGRKSSVTSFAREREVKSFWVRLFMLLTFLICWTPYAVVGVISGYSKVPIWLLEVAAVLAKSSAMFNPLIYAHRAKWKNTRQSFRETLAKSLTLP